MYRRRGVARGLAVVVAVTVVAGLAVAGSAMAAPAGQQAKVPTAPVSWVACPADVVDPLAQLRCALIPVPLDYSEPAGPTIDIMVSRLASPKPSVRRGVLLLNPGGPGGSGLTQPNDLVGLGLPVGVSERFDLIGMDTRGVGHSAPISCGFTVGQAYQANIPPYAADRAAVAKQAEVAKGVAAQCAANDVDGRLRHVSTANMARDLDQSRVALGEQKISYLGLSYGTALGAAYASMFPDRSDRIVLDSNVGDTHLDRDGMRRYGLGMEETFPDFAKWAAARNGTYGLGSTPAAVRQTYFNLAKRLDEHPVGDYTGVNFRALTFVGLFRETSYPKLAREWQGQLRPAGSKATSPVRIEPSKPAGPLSPGDNSWSVFLAVTCNDVDFTADVGAYQRAVAEDRKRYPLYGAATANITPCAFWATEPAEPPVPVVDDGPQNILIVQNRRDPVTPYAGGVLLREKFAQRSKLVSVDGSGHGVYIYGDSACADNTTTDFLVNGTMPATDKRC